MFDPYRVDYSTENSIPSRTAPLFIHSSIHPMVILFIVNSYILPKRMTDVLALLCVCKVFVIIEQMFLVVRVIFHCLVVLHAFENHLTETIIVGNIRHLAIVNLVHQHAGLDRTVYLKAKSIFIEHDPKPLTEYTTVHRFTPYLTIRSLVMGAETLFICRRYASSLMPGFR